MPDDEIAVGTATATGLLRDSDWAPLDGEVCRATSLVHLGIAKGMPYGSIELESPKLSEPTTGFVTHKLDFEHLVAAFSQRDVEPNTEILILWTKQHYKGGAKLVSRFMPRMWVMLCPENAYELWTDRMFKPELQGMERFHAQAAIAEWKPDVME